MSPTGLPICILHAAVRGLQTLTSMPRGFTGILGLKFRLLLACKANTLSTDPSQPWFFFFIQYCSVA